MKRRGFCSLFIAPLCSEPVLPMPGYSRSISSFKKWVAQEMQGS